MKKTHELIIPGVASIKDTEMIAAISKKYGWRLVSTTYKTIIHFEREVPNSPVKHPAYGTVCYVCHKPVTCDWDEHFRKEHPDAKLPSDQFQEEIDTNKTH